MDGEAERLTKLQRPHARRGQQAGCRRSIVNGDLEQRIPGNLNISFAYVEGEALMMGIKNLSVSSGSACTSASLEPSPTCCAPWASRKNWRIPALRIGFGRFTTEHGSRLRGRRAWCGTCSKLREMSPLWEMAQEGIDIKSIEWAAH